MTIMFDLFLIVFVHCIDIYADNCRKKTCLVNTFPSVADTTCFLSTGEHCLEMGRLSLVRDVDNPVCLLLLYTLSRHGTLKQSDKLAAAKASSQLQDLP